MELTTSLRLMRDYGACGAPGSPVVGNNQYPLLVSALGMGWSDDQPIPLMQKFLDLDAGPKWMRLTNTIWALRAVPPEQAASRDWVAGNFCVVLLRYIDGPSEHFQAVQKLQSLMEERASLEEVKAAAEKALDAWTRQYSERAGFFWSAWRDQYAWDDRYVTGCWDAWRALRRRSLAPTSSWLTSILRFLLEFEAAE